MSSNTNRNGGSATSLYVAGASIILIPAMALAMAHAGINSQVAATTSTATLGFFNLLALQHRERTKPHIDKIRETALGRLDVNPLSVATLTAILIVLVSLMVSIIIGGTAILVVSLVTGGLQLPHNVLRAIGTIEVVLTIPILIPIFVYASHRLPPASAFRWILGSILVATVIRFGLFYASSLIGYGSHLSTIQWVAEMILSLLPAWLAHLWARSTHNSFLVARLVRSLPPEDQQTILDLLTENAVSRDQAEGA